MYCGGGLALFKLKGDSVALSAFYDHNWRFFPQVISHIRYKPLFILCHNLILANLSQPALAWQTTNCLFAKTGLIRVKTTSLTLCVIPRLQMDTIAKPRIMHVCNVQ